MIKLIKVETLVSIFLILFLVNGYNCKIVQFIFGDSLSDVGNNNYLAKSLARASLPWYGIDFGNGLPNGRFSNGRTVADIIGKLRCCTCELSSFNMQKNYETATIFPFVNSQAITWDFQGLQHF